MALVHLAPELLLEIITECHPESLCVLRTVSSHLNEVVDANEDYICRVISQAWNLKSNKPKTLSLKPTKWLQLQWRRQQLNETFLNHVNLTALQEAREALAVDVIDKTDTPEQSIRSGLSLLWAYEDARKAEVEVLDQTFTLPKTSSTMIFLNSLTTEELDMLYGLVGICADMLLKLAFPTYFEDEWDNDGRMLLGLDPQYYIFLEMALVKGVSFVVKAVEGVDDYSVKSIMNFWGRNEGIHALLNVRRRKAAWAQQRRDSVNNSD
ncbi:MAG: hypothetical protein M1827_005786 [Pycnora praestabilis]|nr:MAG: hypothetical protein M1827_005786 [Pycnora praestabilis]